MVVLHCEFVSDWLPLAGLPNAGVLVPVFAASGFFAETRQTVGEVSF